MKIVVAPDSFKGSLTSTEAATQMKRGIVDIFPSAQVVMKPMADGGDGTLEALVNSTDGEVISLYCKGPLGDNKVHRYGLLNKHTAIIEMAAIAGLIQVPEEKRHPDLTTTYGIGEAILHAIDQGAKEIIIGLGGSATNDGGLGMLQALGAKAWDDNQVEVGPFGKDLLQLRKLDLSKLDLRLKRVKLKVACGVDNPLCGDNGATAVYGPQKGIKKEQINDYDQALYHFSEQIEKEIGKTLSNVPGAGAAGGMGFALLALGAELVSGATLVAKAINLEQAIKDANFVITGEGKSDEQTLYGKAPGHIAALSKKYGVPAILISGSVVGDIDRLHESFAGCFSVISSPISLQESMEQAGELLYRTTKQVVHFVRTIT